MAQLRLVVCMMVWAWARLASFASTACGWTADKAVVPTMVKFSGQRKDGNGEPLTGMVGVTFALYGSEQGGRHRCGSRPRTCSPSRAAISR